MSDATEAPVEEPGTPAVEAEKPEQQETGPSKAEADALRRAGEAERKAKRAEEQLKKRDEEEAAKQGEWQKLAEQSKAELATERMERERVEREARITRLAGRLKFLDPQDVIGRITAADGAEEASVEAALARIAQQSPHLIAKEVPAAPEIGQVLAPSASGVPGAPVQADGKPSPPAGKPPVNSLDEWEALTQSERIARMAEADWLAVHEQQ